MNAETILNAAMGVLQHRGRCKANFVLADGSVDPLGAIGVARGMEPDIWMGLRELSPSEIYGTDKDVVDAARFLAEAAVPGQCPLDMPVNDLVGVLGDWADAASDEEVYDAFTKAAHLAEQGGDKYER